MANLQKIVKVTQAQYDTLASGGTVGSYTGLNDNYVYLIEDTNEYITSNGGTINGGNIDFYNNCGIAELDENDNVFAGFCIDYYGSEIIYNSNNDYRPLFANDNGEIIFSEGGDYHDSTTVNTGMFVVGDYTDTNNYVSTDAETGAFYYYDSTDDLEYELLLPHASGTLALTSDLSSYVDLTSAQDITGVKTFTTEIKLANTSNSKKFSITNDATNNRVEFNYNNTPYLYLNETENAVKTLTLIPVGNSGTKDLGSSSQKWKDIYSSGYFYGNNARFNLIELQNGTNALGFSNSGIRPYLRFTDGNNTNYGYTLPNSTSLTANSELVDTASVQTISGVKTYTSSIIGPGLENSNGTGVKYVSNDLDFYTGGTRRVSLQSSNLFPRTSMDLGRSGNKWKDLYLSGNISDGTNSISVANIQSKLTAGTGIAINNNVISSTLDGVDYEVVSELPLVGKKGTIYLVPNGESGSDNIYDEYIWVTTGESGDIARFEFIGTTETDLTNYPQKNANETITGSWSFHNIAVNQILGENSQGYWSSNTIRPVSSDTYSLGSSTLKWNNLYLSGNLTDGTNSVSIANIDTINTAQTISGLKTVTQGVKFQSSSNSQDFTIKEDQSWLKIIRGNTDKLLVANTYFSPASNGSYSLGNSNYKWNDLYLSGSVDFGDGATITKDSSNRLNLNYNSSAKVKIGSAETTFVNRIGADSDNSIDIGRSTVRWKDLYLAGKINPNSSTYGLSLPDTTNFTADKEIATTDYVEANASAPSGTTPTTLTGLKVGNNYYTVSSGGGGSATDVQINGTSITSGGVANILTQTAYNSSTNKIATMSDVPSVSLTTTTGSEAITVGSASLNVVTRNTAQTISGVKTFSENIQLDSSGWNYIGIQSGAPFISSNTGVVTTNGSLLPASTDAKDLGSSVLKWKDLYLSGVGYLDTISVSSSLLIKQGTTSRYNFTTWNILPYSSQDLGSSSYKFKDAYLSGSLSDGTNSITVANIQSKVEVQRFI